MGSSAEDPRIGLVLNSRYRITHRLGEGGMGVVYRGERVELQKPVAIKFLHSPYARSQKFVSRFQREARAMSRLSHPCCVSVMDFGVHEAPYIVMDFVTGATLRDVLDDGRVPPARGIAIVKQILSGLSHAHGQGVVHRDIKPGNIMLGEAAGMGDHVRIFDFGLAKLHDPGLEGEPSMVGIVGTPCYMAPEQARGDKVDARADLYATGIVLFELLTGQKPFDGEDSVSILRMQRERPPPKLRALAPELSVELEQVVSRALEKDLMKRFQSASEFLEALERVPEAQGRAPGTTSSERDKDKSEDPVAFAETQQVSSPRVERTTSHPSITSSARRSDDLWAARMRRASLLFILGLAVGGGAWWAAKHRGLSAANEPASQTAVAVPEVPGNPPAPPMEVPPPDEPAATPTPEPQPNQPAAFVPSPEASTNEPDDLSAAQLAAADRALDQDTESEAEAIPDSPAVESRVATTVKTLDDVKKLVDAGRIDDAITGIRRLRRGDPNNPQLPFLLGELYFKRGWWSDGLAKYRDAIRIKSSFKDRPVLQKNTIEALGADKTYARARALIMRDIGRSIAPRLRQAARSDPSDSVRSRAKFLLKHLF